jgi:hypothetical protein
MSVENSISKWLSKFKGIGGEVEMFAEQFCNLKAIQP